MNKSYVVVLAMAALGAPALAEQHVFPITNETYRSECGSCHIPYPPSLLPRQSWQAILAGLQKHFGSDASLDAETVREIEAYLIGNAARRPAAGAKPPLRITETRWFLREHDEVPAAIWKHPAVQRPSNCGACHPRAEQGDFSERGLRVPRY